MAQDPKTGPAVNSPSSVKFPDNVQFVHGNYVLECDELLGDTDNIVISDINPINLMLRNCPSRI